MGTYTPPPTLIEVEKSSWDNIRMFHIDRWTLGTGVFWFLNEKSMLLTAIDSYDLSFTVNVLTGDVITQDSTRYSGYAQQLPFDTATSIANKYAVLKDFKLNKLTVYKYGKLHAVINVDPLPIKNVGISRSGRYIIWFRTIGDARHWFVAT
ncbi:MAG: hypothetical protein QXW26_04720 [Candidatus Nitrosocaldus sp.]